MAVSGFSGDLCPFISVGHSGGWLDGLCGLEAEQGGLAVPIERRLSVLHQLHGGEAGGLAPFDNGFDNGGTEESEAYQLVDILVADIFSPGDCGHVGHDTGG